MNWKWCWAVSCAMLSAFCQAAPLTLTLQEYPPFMGEQLPAKGMLTEAVVRVFERAGYPVELQYVPNNRAIEAPRQGAVDGSFGWARTPERERDLMYTAPVMSLRMVFCQRVGAQVRWEALTDLTPYRIGTTLGNFYSSDFDRLVQSGKLHTDNAPSDVANLKKLLAGRIDLFPIDAEVGPYLMSRHLTAAQRARLTCPDKAYWSAPMHVVISRKRADGAAIVAAFDKALSQMQLSGELERLIAATRQRILAQPPAK
ncbi:substrate-binding periplasmic protein [Chitinolyticbacter meiyuanensis]|uniref:substrate-binding periplasmic protein n=1 Tax=Chitinolyticbacter meiyuanensis TaxID=682798 RepID=UPI0016521EC3|nr:transporter substrate-binding domain-containing protein [Chitinolyticbacter meiyuanensis]